MDTVTARNKLIFAMDVRRTSPAHDLAQQLAPHVGMFKVGLELFISGGPIIVRELSHLRPIMLDLKLHDIPETVTRAVEAAGELGVKFVTLHVQQRETLKKAVEVAKKYPGMTLLGVTVLTSLAEEDLSDLYMPSDIEPAYYMPEDRAVRLAKFAYANGLCGFVCSPKEVRALREALPWHETMRLPKPVIVTPGVRPKSADANDQRRFSTPGQAIQDGADYLVVGRPIRDAADPAAAAHAIVKEIAGASDPA